ncbi:flap endonuclease-1 [Natronomonas sp.]|uniref:flap endonuclease-1 n=1 Tax=Natronomonas sp. TaxID=2184060 RepID=UPI00262E2F0D|nr:flap endonuclease-1 [Natronomonas sp.]
MGNADLRQLATIETTPFGDLGGSVVAVDAHNWLYRYLTTTVRFTSRSAYTTDDGEEVANLIGVVRGLPTLLEHDVTPVFVFDGGTAELKGDEIDARREQRERYEDELETAREDGADAAEISTLESRTQRLTPTIQETTRELLARLDVPIVEAPAEGEAQAAHMARRGDADYAGSEDYDALLLGAPRTLRGLTGSGDPECMDFERTLSDLGVSWEGLVDAAILMGTDFNDGIDGVGPKTAIELIREHGDLRGALDARGESIAHADRIRRMFLDPAVTDDYEYDTDITPDVAAAERYVTEEWEVPIDQVERGFERIETATVQTGLDRWS